MNIKGCILLLFGLSLVITLVLIIFRTYSVKKKDEIEEAKYRMLDDED